MTDTPKITAYALDILDNPGWWVGPAPEALDRAEQLIEGGTDTTVRPATLADVYAYAALLRRIESNARILADNASSRMGPSRREAYEAVKRKRQVFDGFAERMGVDLDAEPPRSVAGEDPARAS